MNPLRYFLVPLAAIAGLGFLLMTQYGNQWSGLVILPLIAGAAVLSLGPQVKWWYWQRRAPDLPAAYAPLLEQFGLYRKLDATEKREFRRRTFLLREATQFLGQAIEKIPPDVQTMVAASAATVSFGRKDMLFPEFDSVVFYKHNFPSPQFKQLHASELYVPDGTLLFNMPTFVRSVFEPHSFLQLGLYEFGRIYQIVYPGAAFPPIDWETIYGISRFGKEKILAYIGLEKVDQVAVGIVLYFTHSESFLQGYPTIYQGFSQALKQEKLALE